ncbi:MAG: kynureninase [Bacteroidota bacterium]
MRYENTIQFARDQDAKDPLKKFRERFYFPIVNGKEAVYFTGNSLGLQPKSAQEYVLRELEDWATFGVEGHFHARKPWFSYHEQFAAPVSRIVGAKPSEVVVMNQLTSNIHFLFVSFYRPSPSRYKILCEAKAFPSDQYAIESQVKFHGYDPGTAIIEVAPRPGEHCIRHEDILSAIDQHKNELALVFIGGVNYYSGQVFDMKGITEAGHKAGAAVGFDLAHAAGNIKMDLHAWNVDFAAWCTYKYLNSFAGSVGGAFVHEKHHGKDLPVFAGWWGHDKSTRFKMEKGFKPIPTAEAWQVSNAPVLSMAAHKAAVEIFDEAGMDALVEKSKRLTGYLDYIIRSVSDSPASGTGRLEIITPEERGCQLSIIAHGMEKGLHEKLTAAGVISDWREANLPSDTQGGRQRQAGVIRCAPVPLYNSFEDVYRFGEALKQCI